MNMYKKSVTRECSLFDIKAWYEGEGGELEKLIGIGFFNHIFLSRDGIVTLYYDVEEADRFDEWLDENFTEEFFNELCDNFWELTEKIYFIESNEAVFELTVKMWPALLFFDEFSKYPEWGNDAMIRRLIRIRASTESASYKLANKVIIEDSPKDYILFKGKIYFQDFDDFCKEKEIEISD